MKTMRVWICVLVLASVLVSGRVAASAEPHPLEVSRIEFDRDLSSGHLTVSATVTNRSRQPVAPSYLYFSLWDDRSETAPRT